MDLMINNVRVLTMEAEQPVLEEGFVGVRDGEYTLVSRMQPRIMARRFVDGTGMTFVPLGALEGTGKIWPGHPADGLLLAGSLTAEMLPLVHLSDVAMVLRGGKILWEKAAQA